jgi:WD40 repeat protein
MLLNLVQSSTLSPAQPTYVLRGHSAQVHSLHFLRDNLRLLSGDADGWVILWNIPIRRPVAVWQAHKDTVLGIGSWNDDNIITFGITIKFVETPTNRFPAMAETASSLFGS